jgi:hypothetical protein
MIAALAADQLERVGVAAFHPAVHDPGPLAAEVRGPAVAGLASKRERRASLGVKAQPRVTGHGTVRAVPVRERPGNWLLVVRRLRRDVSASGEN